MKRQVTRLAAVGIAGLVVATALFAAPAATADGRALGKDKNAGLLPGGYQNLVVIFEENHSFDNLYGSWGKVGSDRVDGVESVPQVAQDGTPYTCLLQKDVNLTSPSPLPSTCTDPAHGVPASAFTNRTFSIDDYIKAEDTTCPPEGVSFPNGILNGSGLPGGCTRDLVHRFYQEQYQLHGGQQDRYVTGSDAAGLTMGGYRTQDLPIYRYLHSKEGPNYVVADRFFQGAFGGSFLNHQWLIAARAPLDTSTADLYSKLDDNGMPTSYPPLYQATKPASQLRDGQLTVACPAGGNDVVKACGRFAVNTIQPSSAPSGGGAKLPLIDDAAYPNIGDRMTAGGVSWNWYAGGWNNAVAGHPGRTFQYHHQPFNYFAAYAPGQPGRAHLKDEDDFKLAAQNGTLPQVSFVKPYGIENEHPGYASEPKGSESLVDLLKLITSGPQARETLVVVTYDEFGGQFDHVPPPQVDAWGPGTRIPALVLSAGMAQSGVDSTIYDTTSIMATIERSFGLASVSTRDAVVNDLSNAVAVGGRHWDNRP
jgi:phospholipase C